MDFNSELNNLKAWAAQKNGLRFFAIFRDRDGIFSDQSAKRPRGRGLLAVWDREELDSEEVDGMTENDLYKVCA